MPMPLKKHIGTLSNFTKHLYQNPPEPHKVSAPDSSGTSPSIFSAKTLRNLTRSLHRNLPEPHKVSAPEPSGTAQKPQQVSSPEPSRTSRGICTGKPSEISRGICTRTLRNLVRNLVLKLHRIAPELIWAKDPIAKFCCWRKTHKFWGVGVPKSTILLHPSWHFRSNALQPLLCGRVEHMARLDPQWPDHSDLKPSIWGPNNLVSNPAGNDEIQHLKL